METYDWPGNVRELQNVLHTYVTLGKLDLMGQISMETDENGPVARKILNWEGNGLRRQMDDSGETDNSRRPGTHAMASRKSGRIAAAQLQDPSA
jgi:DNA-binding NtrC family response regulator